MMAQGGVVGVVVSYLKVQEEMCIQQSHAITKVRAFNLSVYIGRQRWGGVPIE